MDFKKRDRLIKTLNHDSPDRVCVDFSGTAVTGMAVSVVDRLRREVLGEDDYRVKVIEPYQMLGEMDDRLSSALAIDVAGLGLNKTMFGFANERWKPFTLFDGTEVLVPGDFNVSPDGNGGWFMHPEGDLSVPPSAHMPPGGNFFDAINRQIPFREEDLDPTENLEEFKYLNDQDIRYLGERAAALSRTGMGVIFSMPGTGFGDIAHVPAVGLKCPRGIRDIEEWYISTTLRPDYLLRIFDSQCEIALSNLERLIPVLKDHVQVIFLSGTDFGMQNGLIISPQTYRMLFQPYHRKVNDFIHSRTNWKTFVHSCGSVDKLIPDLIEAGFDVLNPVQTSAAGMDPRHLKREYGADLVFWGGGVDTQKTLPFGSPDQVYRQVRERIDILNDGGGFIFNGIHNIQANTPVENLLALFRAVSDSG